MRQDIHPEYKLTNVTCSCGNSFTTRSVTGELHVELCNQCHPFYTGKQKLVDTGGRVERFQKKYAANQRKRPAVPAPVAEAPAAEATAQPEAEAPPVPEAVTPDVPADTPPEAAPSEAPEVAAAQEPEAEETQA